MQDIIPHKDLNIQMKALWSVPMMVWSKVMHFTKDSVYFVRGIDVEGLIRRVGFFCHLPSHSDYNSNRIRGADGASVPQH